MGTRGGSATLWGEQIALHTLGRAVVIVPQLCLRPGLWNTDGALFSPAVLNLNPFLPTEHPKAQMTKCAVSAFVS